MNSEMNSEINSQAFSEWLGSLPLQERTRALALMYSDLTVRTRALFLPRVADGKEQAVLNMLHGINELHHTLANFILRWEDQDASWPPHVLSEQLFWIANQYRLASTLRSVLEFTRSRHLYRETKSPRQ